MQTIRKIVILTIYLVLPISLNAFNLFSQSSLITDNLKDFSTKKILNKKLKTNVSLKDLFNFKVEQLINANIINIPGLFGLGIKCDIDKNIPIIDPCKLIKPVSTKFSFSLGPCRIDVGLSDKCIYQFYKKQCKAIMNKYLDSPIKTARASAKNLKTTGDIIIKKYSWNNQCSTLLPSDRLKNIKNPQNINYSDILKKYDNPQIVYRYAIPSTGNNGIFDSNLVKWKDCIFNNAGKPNALKQCNIIKHTMPKTEYDVQNQIVSGVLMLNDNSIDPLNNDYKNLLIAQKFFATKCANSDNPQSCEDDYWNNGFKTDDGREINFKKIYNKRLIQIEKSNALLLKYIQYATLPDKEIIFLSEDFIQTLPADKREQYRKKAQKIMYQKILNNYFVREITEEEKANISIEFDAMKVASSQFYPKQAMQEIQDLVNTFSMLGKEK